MVQGQNFSSLGAAVGGGAGRRKEQMGHREGGMGRGPLGGIGTASQGRGRRGWGVGGPIDGRGRTERDHR